MSKNTGGPAFPITVLGETLKGQEGMTLRDYFAAKAMQGMLSDPNFDRPHSEVAHRCYLMADAMLEEREK